MKYWRWTKMEQFTKNHDPQEISKAEFKKQRSNREIATANYDFYKKPGFGLQNSVNCNKIVSKQNLICGRETCKGNSVDLRQFFSPKDRCSPIYPTKSRLVQAHKDSITCIKFCKLYDFIISSGMDGRVVLHMQQPVKTFFGHSMGVSGISLSLDEMGLTTVSYDKWAKRWDIPSGRCFSRTMLHSSACAVSGSTPTVATGCADGSVVLLDARVNTPVMKIAAHASSIKSIALGLESVGCVSSTGQFAIIDLRNQLSIFLQKGTNNTIYKYTDKQLICIHQSQNIVSNIDVRPDGTDYIFGAKGGFVRFGKVYEEIKVGNKDFHCISMSHRDNKTIGIGYSNGDINILY